MLLFWKILQEKRVELAKKPKGTPEGEGVYLTVYSKLTPNTDSILF